MPDREKVMRGLKVCGDPLESCKLCPYFEKKNSGRCFGAISKDAIALLKEQEARVMTREEVLALPEGAVVWFEERADDTRDYIGPLVSDGKGYFGDFERGVDMHAVDLKRNRCWSARPTDEQRKAAAWDA